MRPQGRLLVNRPDFGTDSSTEVDTSLVSSDVGAVVASLPLLSPVGTQEGASSTGAIVEEENAILFGE